MGRLLKSCCQSLPTLAFVFILSAVGSSLFNAQPASALVYSVPKNYTVYYRSGWFIYYNGVDGMYEKISWAPEINIAKVGCDSSPAGGEYDFNTTRAYWNCDGLNITAGSTPAGSKTWLKEANYSYIIGDFDWSETLRVTGGRIAGHGASTNNPTDSNRFIQAKSGETAAECDHPNNPPIPDNNCSVFLKFNHSYNENYSITLHADNSNHEFSYKGLQTMPFHILTFNPNGGSLTDAGDNVALLHYPSADNINMQRDYRGGNYPDWAINFPAPTLEGQTFQGWYTAASGGTLVSSRLMNSDETLYAHWGPSANFSLTPSVSVNPTVIEQGGSYNVTPKIENTGTSASGSENWVLTRTVTPAVTGTPTAYSGTLATIPISAGTPMPITGPFSPDANTDYNAGTKICWVLSVTPGSNSGGTVSSVAGAPGSCATVGKKPKVQVWGGDLSVGNAFSGVSVPLGSDVITSISVKSGNPFGSWVEYAIFATGTISGTASGSAFAGPGSSAAYANTKDYSTLSFTNDTASNSSCMKVTPNITPTHIGCYKSARSIPNIASSFPVSSATNILLSSDIGTLQGIYKVNGTTATISTSNISKHHWVVINAPGADVTITGDITYTRETLSNIGDIPQVVIIANSIVINSNVKNVDAWLIAKSKDNTVNSINGSIYTCDLSAPTAGQCKDRLTVNGPVMAQHLYLRRTAGSDPCNGSDCSPSGYPAEVFNLRADAYLWAFAQASGAGRIQTVYTTELPPRF